MEKFLPNESRKERLQVLRDNAEKSEQFRYPKQLSEEELTNLKHNLSQQYIELDKHEEAKKEYMADFKAKTDPIKKQVKFELAQVRTGVLEVEEEVFLVADHDDQLMRYYNAEGDCVYKRALMPQERQMRIIGDKNGTSNE